MQLSEIRVQQYLLATHHENRLGDQLYGDGLLAHVPTSLQGPRRRSLGPSSAAPRESHAHLAISAYARLRRIEQYATLHIAPLRCTPTDQQTDAQHDQRERPDLRRGDQERIHRPAYLIDAVGGAGLILRNSLSTASSGPTSNSHSVVPKPPPAPKDGSAWAARVPLRGM